MAKWSGTIGYIKPEEIEPGLWADEMVVEKQHYGDLIKNTNKNQYSPESTSTTMTLLNNVSIVADAFATDNYQYMTYAIIRGVKWRIMDIEVQYPRLILSIGGIYNGKQT